MSNTAVHLFREIEESLETKPACGSTRILTIDGRAGSGKTTLASDLFLYFSTSRKVEIIHMDDLYGGWDDALTSRLTGTLIAIVEKVREGEAFTQHIYNWHTASFDATKSLTPPEVLIIEGVGSGQSAIRDDVAAAIWMEISPETGLRRVLDRDGETISEEMKQWQMMEARHFEIEQTFENADFVLSTN